MWNIRDACQHGPKGFIQLFHTLVESSHALVHRPPLPLQLCRIGALLTELPNLSASGLLLRLELLRFGNGRAPLGIQRSKLRYIKLKPARSQTLGDGIEIRSKLRQVMHDSFICVYPRSFAA
jgi:hypothetical protein